ncbi:uncharacterized protein LOC142321702 [Lycorma delicatula]|uniref:uncharacterized protein LOC142321702 n=1 Tax=Lycorma delicatula TaxID=130591 RepID=UPI003F512EA5
MKLLRHLLDTFIVHIKRGTLEHDRPSKFIEKIRFLHYDLNEYFSEVNKAFRWERYFNNFYTRYAIVSLIFLLFRLTNKTQLSLWVTYLTSMYLAVVFLSTRSNKIVREIIKDLLKMNTAFIDDELNNEIYFLVSQLHSTPFNVCGSFGLVITNAIIIEVINEVIDYVILILQLDREEM